MVRADHPRRRRWLWATAIAGLVLVAGELAVRATDQYLPAPDLWADQATAVKVAQLDEIDCADVVFAGSSMARDAFDPTRFSSSDPGGRSSYNAALDAAAPTLLEPWLLDQVVPRADPAAVVIGLASFELNEGSSITQAAADAYERAPYSGHGFANEVQRWFTERLALVRHRPSLRDPSEWGAAWDRWRDGAPAERPSAEGIDGVLAADGHGLSRRDRVYTPSPGAEAFVTDELLRDFALSEEQQAALERLIRALEERGVDVALVELPVTDDYLDLHPRGAADDAAFRSAVQEIADRTGAVVVPRLEVPQSEFADTHHLNAEGADRFSSSLPQRLEEAGLSVERC